MNAVTYTATTSYSPTFSQATSGLSAGLSTRSESANNTNLLSRVADDLNSQPVTLEHRQAERIYDFPAQLRNTAFRLDHYDPWQIYNATGRYDDLNSLQKFARWAIHGYQKTTRSEWFQNSIFAKLHKVWRSQNKGGGCPFALVKQDSCSEFTVKNIERKGFFVGGFEAAWRMFVEEPMLVFKLRSEHKQHGHTHAPCPKHGAQQTEHHHQPLALAA